MKILKGVFQITKEQEKLIEENHNLIYSFLQKYNLSVEDYYDLAAIGLCKAGMNFNGNISKFSTYAYEWMFGSVFSEIRKEKRMKKIPDSLMFYYQAELENNNGGDTSVFMNYVSSKENVEEEVLSKVHLNKYLKKLKEKEKQIIILLYKGYNQIETGKIMGCSQAQVSKVRKKLYGYLMN